MGDRLPHGRARSGGSARTMRTGAERIAFIRANTRVHPVPHAPEIRLHLADEAMELWQKTEAELEEMNLPPPFWAFAWAGGQALARYLLDHRETVAGRHVLDFATGSGLAAIAAAIAGAARVTACDIDAHAQSATELNAALNRTELEILHDDLLTQAPPPVDVIMCGDVFYEEPMAARVLPWLEQACSSGTRVLVGDPGRTYLPRERLRLLATYDVEVNRSLEDLSVKRTSVFDLLAPDAT
uniref:class I SAM-dependent methyltransferase n=1 Tax=Stappia sp. TaxID=1870903 RepID=UPI003BA9CCDD